MKEINVIEVNSLDHLILPEILIYSLGNPDAALVTTLDTGSINDFEARTNIFAKSAPDGRYPGFLTVGENYISVSSLKAFQNDTPEDDKLVAIERIRRTVSPPARGMKIQTTVNRSQQFAALSSKYLKPDENGEGLYAVIDRDRRVNRIKVKWTPTFHVTPYDIEFIPFKSGDLSNFPDYDYFIPITFEGNNNQWFVDPQNFDFIDQHGNPDENVPGIQPLLDTGSMNYDMEPRLLQMFADQYQVDTHTMEENLREWEFRIKVFDKKGSSVWLYFSINDLLNVDSRQRAGTNSPLKGGFTLGAKFWNLFRAILAPSHGPWGEGVYISQPSGVSFTKRPKRPISPKN